MMSMGSAEIRSGITLFNGRISHNLMFDPMVSHTYVLEDGDEMMIFDPSCGKEISDRIETHIRNRLRAKTEWEIAILIAGHSHMDHANNFRLSDAIGAKETHIYVHESSFQDGQVMNEPIPFIERMIEESRKYYNPYLAFPFPYNLLMYPLAALDKVSSELARAVFSRIGSIPWPAPANGHVRPEPLKDGDMQEMDLGDVRVKGWRIGDKIILPTPGHSPCSVSLFWPEKKAIFVSDADWIGNPVFISSSLKDCISSLEKIRELTITGKVDLFFPAHGQAKEGVKEILSHLDFHIRRLEVIRSEVLSAYHSYGEEKDVRKLARVLAQDSPLFRMLKMTNFPRLVVFIHNMVAVCLREEGIIMYPG